MELRRYLSVLRRHAFLVCVTVAVALGVGYAATPRAKAYASHATLFVGTRSFAIDPRSNLPSSDPLVAAELASVTYSKMITSLPTAELAVQRTGVPRSPATVVAETSASEVGTTTLIQLKVVDPNPQIAAQLANAEARAIVDELGQVEPAGQGGGLPISVFEPASVPGAPQPSALRRNLELAGVFGFLAAVALALVLEYLDLTVRNGADVQRRLELPVLGAVPLYRVRA